MSDSRFNDKIVVITGSASGIGLASARRFAAEGATVVIVDLSGEAAESAADSINEAGGRAWAIQGDVSKEAEVESNVTEVMSKYGRVDVLVNNAGKATVSPAEDYRVWDSMLAVNLSGPFHWAQKVGVASMIPRRQGAIVNVASLSGLTAHPFDVGYMASKHGLVGLTKGLAVDWAIYGIRVNAVCPGLTLTPIQATIAGQGGNRFDGIDDRIPLHRAGEPDEQAAAITFLASDDASYITGAALNVDGGILALKSLFPPRMAGIDV